MNTYLNELFNLDGKVAVVIGAGGHLCSEMAKGLAKAGCSVAILDIRLEKAEAVSNDLKIEEIDRVMSLAIDVSEKAEHINVLNEILEKFGQVDILINGAGIFSHSPFLEITLDEWHAVLDSQLTGTFLGCQVFGSHMVERGGGSIINISSISAGPPLSKAFTYSVAKAGINNLTQNLGREWAKKGVRVNAVRPGFFPNEFFKNSISKEREVAILRHTPMERFGKPKELLGAIFWLASDASSFVTGAEISVDGGFSCMTI